MPALPAFCDNCGYVFASALVFPGMGNTFFENYERCPRCKSVGARVLEGTMNIDKDTIEILQQTEATAEQLARLAELLRKAQEQKQPAQEIAAEIERELPGLSVIAKRLLIPKNAGELWSLVGAVAATATLLIALKSQPTKTVYEDRSVHQMTVYSAPLNPSQPAVAHPTKKVGRNEPCPCGSGKRYKHCHGAIRAKK